MILYFVRHGETDLNAAYKLQGRALDEPLNENGVREIQELVPSLPTDFEIIYASPLKRVVASAEIIASHTGKPIVIREEISERDFGSLAGKSWDDIPNGAELEETDKRQAYNFHPYGGEAVDDVATRLQNFFEEVKTSGHPSALVVSSKGIIRLVYTILLGQNVVEIENASIHQFEI
jgi:probable phosphoglycerate mutase